MDDVIGRDQKTNFFAHRQHQIGVHLQQVVLAFFLLVQYLGPVGAQVAIESNTAVDVVVAPFPLVSRNFDGHVRLRGVLHVDQCCRGGNGHAN